MRASKNIKYFPDDSVANKILPFLGKSGLQASDAPQIDMTAEDYKQSLNPRQKGYYGDAPINVPEPKSSTKKPDIVIPFNPDLEKTNQIIKQDYEEKQAEKRKSTPEYKQETERLKQAQNENPDYIRYQEELKNRELTKQAQETQGLKIATDIANKIKEATRRGDFGEANRLTAQNSEDEQKIQGLGR